MLSLESNVSESAVSGMFPCLDCRVSLSHLPWDATRVIRQWGEGVGQVESAEFP